MKKYIKFLNVLMMIALFSCASVNDTIQKDIFLSEFLNNESVSESLRDYYPNKLVTIYDKDKILVQATKKYGSNSKTVNITTTKPITKDYFLIYNFILNKNLATIVLATSNMDDGVIFYLKRNEEKDKWVIMNIIPKSSR